MLKEIVLCLAIIILGALSWEIGMARTECNELIQQGKEVHKGLLTCQVLVNDQWISSKEYFKDKL